MDIFKKHNFFEPFFRFFGSLLPFFIFFLSFGSVSQAAIYESPDLLGTSAEMIGVANIQGFSRTASVIFENPAGLYQVRRGSFSAFTTTIMEDNNYTNLAVALRTKWGLFGAGYMAQTIPNNHITDSKIVPPDRFFTYSNALYKFSYYFSPQRRVHMGFSLLHYEKNFGSVATGQGNNLEFGAIYRVARHADVSVVARNLIPDAKVDYSNGGSEVLPLTLIGSGRYMFSSFELFSQLQWEKGLDGFLLSGAARYYVPLFRGLYLSAGYKQYHVKNDVDGNFTLGLGLRLGNIYFNYAYDPSDYIEAQSNSYFSMGINF